MTEHENENITKFYQNEKYFFLYKKIIRTALGNGLNFPLFGLRTGNYLSLENIDETTNFIKQVLCALVDFDKNRIK